MTRAIFFNAIAIIVFLAGIVFFFSYVQPNSSPEKQLSAASVSVSTSRPIAAQAASSTLATTTTVRASSVDTITVRKPTVEATNQTSTTTDDQISRIQNPYTTPPESFDQVNADSRNAIVNILCEPDGSSSLSPISGSGVIIDPRGIVLTNAHVAQYVLLSESPQINLQCFIRSGSPATAQWSAAVLYIPPVWVTAHADEINEPHPTGTGEHDYALLYITGSVTNNPLPPQFPYLPVDTRWGIGFPEDQVLVASYPAELVGGIAAQYDLYADSSVTTIKQLLTFGAGTPDLVSLGGIIEAQGGSSGGAVVNQWGRLIALIATTSEGTTTSERDLRGISLAYIDSDLQAQSGTNLNGFLQGDPATEVQNFSPTAESLIQLYVQQISSIQQ